MNSRRRLLLTGTPIENAPRELLCLLSFVAPRVFTIESDSARGQALLALFAVDATPEASAEAHAAHGEGAGPAGGRGGDVGGRGRGRGRGRGQHGAPPSALDVIRSIVSPFVLRRLKSHVLCAGCRLEPCAQPTGSLLAACC